MAKFKIATPSVSGQTTWAPYKLTKTIHFGEMSGNLYDEMPLTWDGSYDLAESIFAYYMPFVCVQLNDGDDTEAYSEVNTTGWLWSVGAAPAYRSVPPRSYIVEMRCHNNVAPWIIKYGGFPGTFGTGYDDPNQTNEGQKSQVIVHALGYGA